MNITRENLSDLELCIKVDIEENDYIENVNKQLKDYQKKATVPGFRKGMAPMGLIQRMYKGAIVGDVLELRCTNDFTAQTIDKPHILEILSRKAGAQLGRPVQAKVVDLAKYKFFMKTLS